MATSTNRETGKDRWRRVPKDYYKTPDPIERAKLALSALALLLSAAWWASGVDWTGRSTSSTDGNSLRANHGELNRAHAAWDDRCEACHVPFEPIRGKSPFASGSTPESRSSDKLCMACHAGPAHHRAVKTDDEMACAECHNDHQGRDFSLVRMADGRCTNCHANLGDHVDAPKKSDRTRAYGNVARFDAKDHPPFRPEAADHSGKDPVDRSRLKFDHARHMTPGIVQKPGDPPYTIGQVLATERDRYSRAMAPGDILDNSTPVRLDCGSCHVLDSTEIQGNPGPSVPVVPVAHRGPGAYYQPVNFQAQCRACHALTPGGVDGLQGLEVPHGVPPDEVGRFLRNALAAEVVLANPGPRKTEDGPGPKRTLDDATSRALGSILAGKAPNNCAECHYLREKDGMPTLVEPTQIPDVWFVHARFDHTAHRGVTCYDCHSRAYATDPTSKAVVPDASTSATDVLIPGIDNCVRCHAPARSTAGWFGIGGEAKPAGGVAHACTECHTYHNGDNPLQGRGAKAGMAAEARSIEEFLRGSKKP